MLNDSKFEYFEAAFITKVDRPLEMFDLIVRYVYFRLLSLG